MVILIPIVFGSFAVFSSGSDFLSDILLFRLLFAAVGYASFALYCCVMISFLAKSSGGNAVRIRRLAGVFAGAHVRAAHAFRGKPRPPGETLQGQAVPAGIATTEIAVVATRVPGAMVERGSEAARLVSLELALQQLLDDGSHDQRQMDRILAEMDQLRTGAAAQR